MTFGHVDDVIVTKHYELFYLFFICTERVANPLLYTMVSIFGETGVNLLLPLKSNGASLIIMQILEFRRKFNKRIFSKGIFQLNLPQRKREYIIMAEMNFFFLKFIPI